MTKYISDLTADFVKIILDYDHDTGNFRWKINKPPKKKAGDIAGWIGKNGYRYISFQPKCYLAHRLAWLIVSGEWPQNQIDHINGKRPDNRWSNLRQATAADNIRNCARRNGCTLPKGVSWRPDLKKFIAKICVNRKQIYLGMFETKESAHAAYCSAAKRMHGDFANFG